MIPSNRVQRFLANLSKPIPPVGRAGRVSEMSLRGGEGVGRSGARVRAPDFYILAPSEWTRLSKYDWPSPEEIRGHSQLTERLAALRRPRGGVWAKVWRFVRGD
jgi:hypothetical protein